MEFAQNIPTVDAIVVTHDSAKFVRPCLESVRATFAAIGQPVRISVVDNSSTDETLALAHELADQVIESGANPGFGAAVNIGLAKTESPFVLVANADTELLPGTGWSDALGCLTSERTAVAAPAIVDRWLSGSGPFEPVGLSTLVRTNLLNRSMRTATLSYDERHRVAKVDGWPCGACFLVRRDVMDEVAGFDEMYFLYYEEVDLFERVRQAGYEIVWIPSAVVAHAGGGDTRVKQGADQIMLSSAMTLGKVRYFALHHPGPTARLAQSVLALDAVRHSAGAALHTLSRSDPSAGSRSRAWLKVAAATLRYLLRKSSRRQQPCRLRHIRLSTIRHVSSDSM